MPVEPVLVEGVDVEALMAPATAQEIAAVQADWAARQPVAREVAVVREDTVMLTPGTLHHLQIVAHTVDAAIHYGAIASPIGAEEPLPVLLYAHAGDDGIDVDGTLGLIALGFTGPIDRFVFVAPSFRSETLRYDGATYRSTGDPSPLDRDVDDALALLDAAAGLAPADTSRVGVLGFSRGAGVAMLMDARSTRIDAVVAFFGPTDFFSPYARDIVVDALRGIPRDLPGVDFLDEAYIQPLRQGTITLAEARDQLVRRSAVLFASDIGRLQLHHGDADPVVDVGQAHAMAEAMTQLGRQPPRFEVYLYPGAGHNPLDMPASFDRVASFLEPLAPPMP